MTDAPDLVALVGSRIAHDLINPLGAIGNGIELLGLTATGDTPELALITESVANATARIKAFRIAFGAAQPGQSVTESEIRSLLGPGVNGSKLSVDWQVGGAAPRGAVKLAFLALMCLETALPWGGQVTVSRENDAWRVVAEAERMKIAADLWALLSGATVPVDLPPAQVHFALIGPAAAAQGRALSVTLSDSSIRIGF